MKKIMTACALFGCALCAQAYDIVASVSITGTKTWFFDIELADNNIDFTAFQIDITLDGNAKLQQKDLMSGELLSNHDLVLAAPEGHYRVVGYSTTRAIFKKREGRLFTFAVDGNITGITINKIIFSKSDGTEVEADVFTQPLNRDDDAIETVSAEPEINTVTYDMSGKQVYKIDRRGIYIRNGKKIAK